MTLNHIQYELIGSWARITLNEPDKHNALSIHLLRELASALWEADEDREVHAVLIRGAGPSFSSGYDLTPARKKREPIRGEASKFRGYRSMDDDIWRMEQSQRELMTIFDMHKPVVAQVHGNCIAGGLDLALLCDMVIAADDAVLGFPPVRKMGTPPQNMWLYHIPVQWAKRLILTGDTMSGADAAKIGLVLESWPADQLESACEALMNRISLIDPDILTANKRSLNLGLELMGARTLQRLALELDARGHRSEACGEWGKQMAELGLKEALRLRDAGFGDGKVRVRNR
jgi:enoyl-CoA hydratase